MMETVTMLSPCSFSKPLHGSSTGRLENSFQGNSDSIRYLNRPSPRETSAPAQVLVVRAGKRKGPMYRMQQMQQQQNRPIPRMPKAEDDNPRFVIFIKSKNVPLWYPLSIVSGGTAAKFFVGVTKNELGKRVYGNSLTNNIGAAVYKDEEKIVTSIVKAYPTLKTAKEFQFGYKLVDEERADEALRPVDVILIPPKEELKPITEKVTDFVGKTVESVKDSLGLK